MSIVIDRLFTQPYVRSGFTNNEKFYNRLVRERYLNAKNFFPAALTMVILRVLNVSNVFVALSGLSVYIYVTKINIEKNMEKLDLLNSLIFNKNEEPFETESYLEMDQSIIDFYYKNKWYVDYNLTAFRKSLQATNNLLRLSYNLQYNLMRDPEQLYRNAYMEYKEALNNLHSSIYKMISDQVNNDVFNDNLTTLESLLKKHIKTLQKNVIKCGYNLYDINIWSFINPKNIELEDDTKTKNYSPHYSFF